MRLAAALACLLAVSAIARAEDVPAQAIGRQHGPELPADAHTAVLLTSGERSFRARRENIKNADVVLYKTYIFADDETGRETVELLRQKALAGGKVFVEYDVKGTSRSTFGLVGMALGLKSPVPPHLKPLVDAGCVLIPTNVPRLGSMFLGRDHDKLLVTWKAGEPARVIMGGMNVGNHYAFSGLLRSRTAKADIAFRDTDVELTGPELRPIIDRFVEAAERSKSPHVGVLRGARERIVNDGWAFRPDHAQSARAVFVHNDPKAGNKRQIEAMYEKLIDETPGGELVTLSNAYLLPPRRLRDAIVRAAGRGVRFRLLVNAPDAPEAASRLVATAFRDQLRVLMKKIPEHQLEVIEWSGNDRRNEGALHQKIAKFGSKGRVLVGSANLDNLSANHNSETVVVMDHPRIRNQFDALISRSLREGKVRTLTRQTLKQDSWKLKAKGFLLNRVLGRVL